MIRTMTILVLVSNTVAEVNQVEHFCACESFLYSTSLALQVAIAIYGAKKKELRKEDKAKQDEDCRMQISVYL